MQQTHNMAELEQARAVYAEAFNMFGLGRSTDRHEVLTLGSVALRHVRSSEICKPGPATSFVAGRIDDTASLLETLHAAPSASRVEIATALLAVEFLLRALEHQNERCGLPDHCAGCGSPRLHRDDHPGAYRCLDCGLTAVNPPARG